MNSKLKENCLSNSTPNIFSQIAANTISNVIGLQASIWRYDVTSKSFFIIGKTEKIPDEYLESAALLESDSVAGFVYRNGKMELIDNISDETRWKY